MIMIDKNSVLSTPLSKSVEENKELKIFTQIKLLIRFPISLTQIKFKQTIKRN